MASAPTKAACTDGAATSTPPKASDGAAQASWTSVTVKPEVDGGADGRVDAHARHHPADHDVIDASRPQLELRAPSRRKLFGAAFWIERLAGARGDAARGSRRRTYPGRMKAASGPSQTCWMWRTGSPRRRKRSSSRRRSRPPPPARERMRAAREVVVLDVDDEQGPGHRDRDHSPAWPSHRRHYTGRDGRARAPGCPRCRRRPALARGLGRRAPGGVHRGDRGGQRRPAVLRRRPRRRQRLGAPVSGARRRGGRGGRPAPRARAEARRRCCAASRSGSRTSTRSPACR